MCPECDSEGDDYEKSMKDCDDRIELETCEVNWPPVCAVGSFRNSDGNFEVHRGCLSMSEYDQYYTDCKHNGSCVVAVCDNSHCKPDILYCPYSWC